MSGSAARQPVDLDHLVRYTGGENEVYAEVLSLFVQQCAEALARLHALKDSPDSKVWRDTLHVLKGSALGIGAFAFAQELASAESVDPLIAPAEAAEALAAVKRGGDLVNRFITAYLAR
jgi:HPt (histidine-containing phosphotransfer) domain-containing protein